MKAASILPLLLFLAVAPVYAHRDVTEENGEARSAAVEDVDACAQCVRLDKAAQRRAGLRTRITAAAAESVEVPAQVVPNPRHQVFLAADRPGSVEAPPGGFPSPGSTIRVGQVLAFLRPLLQEPERRDLQVAQVLAQRDIDLGHLQIQRYSINEKSTRLDIRLPTASLQTLLDYRTAQARHQHFGAALTERIALTAPVAGLVLHNRVRRGAAVASGEPLFELSTTGLAVEIRIADDGLDAAAADQAMTASGCVLPLHVLGITYDPALRVRRALYAVTADAGDLAVGEPLRVRVPHVQAATGRWLLPAAAVVRRDGDDGWVWIHDRPERFVARRVEVVSEASGWIRIDSGLIGSERVVVEGASALQRHAQLEAGRS